MRVFAIGGVTNPHPDEAQVLSQFCQELGAQLADSPHQIVLCSEHPSSIDRSVLEAARTSVGLKAEAKIIVHRPDDPVIRQSWTKLEREIGLRAPEYHSHKGPKFRSADGTSISSEEGLRMAFLLCQVQALSDCDAVVSIGGRIDGTVPLLLAIAREKEQVVVPYRFLGGAADEAYNRLEGDLKARLSNTLIEKLSDPQGGASVFLEILDRLRGARIGASPRVFLSYPWKCSHYADLVETLLRRRSNVTVFRDERDIHQAENISHVIEEEIREKCDLFIALWCREYVESPYCHDEMALWAKHRGPDHLYLLRFDDTRPVWLSLREAPENRETFRAKWPRIGENREELDKVIGDILVMTAQPR